MCLSGEGPLKGKEVLLSVIAGSISYGLNTKDSDVDIRGVFAHPVKDILVGKYEKVIQEDNNNTIYTEIGFFLEQLRKNTPSALEVLFTTDPEHVKIRDKRFDPLIEKVLSKKCFYTFGAFEYDYLMKLANEKSLELKELFNKSKLPEKPDKEFFKNYILNFYE